MNIYIYLLMYKCRLCKVNLMSMNLKNHRLFEIFGLFYQELEQCLKISQYNHLLVLAVLLMQYYLSQFFHNNLNYQFLKKNRHNIQIQIQSQNLSY